MFCNRQDRKRIKRRASIVCPDYTGPVALLLVALMLVAWVTLVILADIGLI